MCLPKDLKGATIQRIATIVGNILCLNFGIMLGITPAHMRLYMDEQTPLNHIANVDDVTWICSSVFISAALSAVFSGYLVEKIGPKGVLLLSGLLQISSWFCMHFAFDILHIYSSRIMAGMAAGAALTALPIFITEIAEENNSGALITTIEQWRTMGILIGFLLGQHLQYDYVAVVAVCISCAFTILFSFSQESPYFYMRRGDVPRLEKSLRWFRGVRSIDDRNRPEFLCELGGFKSNMETCVIAQEHVPCVYLCKATLCTLVLFVGVQLSGIYVILAWSDLILMNDVFVNCPTDISASILALVQFVAATITVWLAPVVRRRMLLFVSALTCGFASICLAICVALEVKEELRWFASILLLLHVFFANLGMYPLISLLPSEMLASKLRVTLTSVSWGFSWLITFILVHYFQSFESAIGLHGYFIIFGVGCVSIALLALFALPETLGKSLEELQHRWGYGSESGISKNNVPQIGQIHLERY
ncbi:facilitated trehalose transporter Tret1-like [Zeugodacus cucurbitae]|uniref:facilitated trehalose transporter Tret1-like n=1 Tax=Zeugodacus cucurbitae TaxID=28588 RepID=UPI0023D94B9C|nr:facilitated trehalose transporter Tret1-like [Zeugodacus cucurbitae]